MPGQDTGAGLCREPWRSRESGKVQVRCDVHPDFRRRGIGTALYDRLMDLLAEHEATILVARTREDEVEGVRFLANRGFEQVMRSPISHLDVGSFDADRFAGRVLRVADRGIRIEPLACLADADPDWKQKLWALTGELYLDLPSHDSLTQQTFEDFEER